MTRPTRTVQSYVDEIKGREYYENSRYELYLDMRRTREIKELSGIRDVNREELYERWLNGGKVSVNYTYDEFK